MRLTHAPLPTLAPTLATYLQSDFVQGAGFDPEAECYTYQNPLLPGPTRVPGLIRRLEQTYYPHYERKSTKRRRLTLSKGSSAAQGKTVDAQLAASFVKRPRHVLAKAVLEHLQLQGQRLEACQVPCMVRRLAVMTEADVIAKDGAGRLHLYEVKTGYPIGGFRTQGQLRAPLQQVPNTKMNHWQLQLRYTQLALEAAGVGSFASAQVIQVYEKHDKVTKQRRVKTKIHAQPEWVRQLV